MLKEVVYLIVLLLGIPTGIFLAKLCKEEIRKWKFKLKLISLISFIGGIVVYFLNYEYRMPIIISLIFVIIVCLTIIYTNNRKLDL